jgi:hypothetical protein
MVTLMQQSNTTPPLYFWRDQHGHEIDLNNDQGTSLTPVEIKSGATFQTNWLDKLEWIANDNFLDSVFSKDCKLETCRTSVTAMPPECGPWPLLVERISSCSVSSKRFF